MKSVAPLLATDPDRYVRWFKDLRNSDVGLVGGKTASLGEMYSQLTPLGVHIPNGFALTAATYREALVDVMGELRTLLAGIDAGDIALLSDRAAKARQLVYVATDQPSLRNQIDAAYGLLEREYGANVAVAVRSSATAEDLPNASFAGQHDSFLNVSGVDAVFDACRRCFASIFTDRAIVYRLNNHFDHFSVALSVGVMKMVRSDRATSGVTFTLDTDSGFRDVVFVSGAYGLGENIVQGKVEPDEYYIHKPTFRSGYRAVFKKVLGAKQERLVYAGSQGTQNLSTTPEERARFCLEDSEVYKLADDALRIEEHYSSLAGRPVPMDIEWAKDSDTGLLFIVQARPETVASRRNADSFEIFTLCSDCSAPVVLGKAVGEKIASGPVRLVTTDSDLAQFQAGEILVATTTSPDWEPVLKLAAGIITDRGGRTCHAAIIARELGVPAVVGCGDATSKLMTGGTVTISCANGEDGRVYAGTVPYTVERRTMEDVPITRTKLMVNLGNPDLSFRTALLPCAGVGLARMEFIIGQMIGLHPMAVVHPERLSETDRERMNAMASGYGSAKEFFVQTLASGVGTIAAAFYPRPVIIRLSDFKTNEYRKLLGGPDFEPVEANPMLGFRGASRYAHPAYAEGFALECEALRRVRDVMGLSNLSVMVPFCRRIEEARRVVESMAAHGLVRGKNGLEVLVMCEIPNNVILINAFAEIFDGFSIGSNDLTQLTLGVDRDSDIVAFDFDERDPGMLEMLRLAVTGAKRNGRHVGICGEAPANYPEICKFLVELGIDAISVSPASLFPAIAAVKAAEIAQMHP